MPKFKFEMLETRVYDVIYEVEADNLEEAKAKALRGDTVSETDIKCRGVNDRDIWEELV